MQILEHAAGVTVREVIPRIIPVANPAPGAEIAVNVTAGAMWYVESFLASFTASVVVATRTPVLALSDGSTIFARVQSPAQMAASAFARLNWLRGFGYINAANIGVGANGGFPSIPLFGGFQIATVTSNIDVTDQWSSIVLYVLEVEERSYDVELAMDLAALRGDLSNAFPEIPLGS